MKSIYPCIYVDYTNNVWMFFENDNKELCYKIMYGEGKWTRENIIDKDVLGFAIYINEDETIHIVYSNTKKELKYCTMQDKKWVGKVLYTMDDYNFEISNLKVKIIDDTMHIFYVLIDKSGNDHGILKHCTWNGKAIENTVLQDIILVPDLNDYYSVSIDKNDDINVFFVSDDGDEVSFNHSRYKNKKWTSMKRIYGIQGEDIAFEVLSDDEEFHILNKLREDQLYSLEYVSVDISGQINESKVYESNLELSFPIMFTENYRLYSCWLEQGKIFYADFNGEKWSEPHYVDRKSSIPIKRYKCFMWQDEEAIVKEMEIYATDELDISLFVPNNFVLNKNTSVKYGLNKAKADGETTEAQGLKIEILRAKTEKKKLEKKVEYLNGQLQKKQRSIDEYEERITNIVEQKRKVDENYNVFLELQQNIQNELNSAKEKSLEEAKLSQSYKKENEKIKNELAESKIFIEDFKEKFAEISKELEAERNIRKLVEEKLKETQEENMTIKNKINSLNQEKEKISQELEFERNQSIMDRLLRKRSSGI